jgi:hypothetical protein
VQRRVSLLLDVFVIVAACRFRRFVLCANAVSAAQRSVRALLLLLLVLQQRSQQTLISLISSYTKHIPFTCCCCGERGQQKAHFGPISCRPIFKLKRSVHANCPLMSACLYII